jgi:hypothetical protein
LVSFSVYLSLTPSDYQKNAFKFTNLLNSQIMVWKSNITVAPTSDNNTSLDEVSSPKVMEDKENNEQERKNSSITVDARSSANYLPNDDVVDL